MPRKQGRVLGPGSKVWVQDPDRAYTEGEVVEVKKGQATVKLGQVGSSEATERIVPAEELEARVDQPCVGEMDDLKILNIPSVLQNVDTRFALPQCEKPGEGPATIYTNVGPLLIAMNPFQELPLYTEDWQKAYAGTGLDRVATRNLGPHAYRTAQEAFTRLHDVYAQSVVISGESGAGKTVTARKILEYLCTVGGSQDKGSGTVDPQKIVHSNVLLEAFGNAKTTRNHNSSRFGKYSRLNFSMEDGKFQICGVGVEHYLLERIRVCSQAKGERNYHVFYQLLRSGAGKQFGLTGGPEDYAYTKTGADVDACCDDAQDYQVLRESMKTAGFEEGVINGVFQVIAAVLLLGNVQLKGDSDSCSIDPASEATVNTVCKLLSIPADALKEALTHSFISNVETGKKMRVNIGKVQGEALRDTLAKTIYARVFDGIIKVICMSLQVSTGGPPMFTAIGGPPMFTMGGPPTMTMGKSAGGKAKAPVGNRGYIGLLDIFGFEDMATNGFEQMFINLTNERIQHLFNEIMFERELEVYKNEGVDYAYKLHEDRLPCVRLFTDPRGGVIKLLSDSVRAKSSSDGSKLVATFNKVFKDHPSYKVCLPPDAMAEAKKKGLLKPGSRTNDAKDFKECFMVRHYAGTLLYTVQDWVPKSADALLPHLTEVMNRSHSPYITQLFSEENASAKLTIGEKFREQLEVLDARLKRGKTSFVRCIKTNPELKPNSVNRPMVLEQLVHGGVISALNVRHHGLPERMEFQQFCNEFRGLESPASQGKDVKTRCQDMLRPLFDDFGKDQEFAMGRTMVFMKAHVLAYLRIVKRYTLMAAWRELTETNLANKIEQARSKLEEAQELARVRGVLEYATVTRALGNASDALKPMVELLDEMKKAKKTDAQMAEELKKDMERIRPLRGLAEQAEAVVERVGDRKVAATQLLSIMLANSRRKMAKMLEQVQAMEGECENVGDEIEAADKQRCEEACKAARDHIQKSGPLLQALRLQGPQGVDYEAEGDFVGASGSICPKATDLVEEGQKLVNQALEVGEAVLVVRRRFLQALAEMQQKQNDAKAVLDGLQAEAERFRNEGLDDVVDALQTALTLDAEAQAILEAAKDADAYTAAVQAFAEAVSRAEAAVKEGQEELERRERERQERLQLIDELETARKQMEEKLDALRKTYDRYPSGFANIGELLKRHKKLLTDLQALQVTGKCEEDEIAEFKEKVTAMLATKTQIGKEFDEVIAKAEGKSKSKFSDLRDMFNKRPSAEAKPAQFTPPKRASLGGASRASGRDSVGSTTSMPELEPVPQEEEPKPRSVSPRPGTRSAIFDWCKENDLPELLAIRLESESVQDPLDLAPLSASDMDDLVEGLKIGEKGRFKRLVMAMKED